MDAKNNEKIKIVSLGKEGREENGFWKQLQQITGFRVKVIGRSSNQKFGEIGGRRQKNMPNCYNMVQATWGWLTSEYEQSFNWNSNGNIKWKSEN